ncbi:carboxymuconolactone decarboxylase family protein [Dactylosporangium roseum]|uniref:Carboxymuconolactone decarboxylase family protein n=2 Tax=Dactylosporangium roseum TaxID=47989 RepID=A0ABY5ZBJ1_9ACTN|nr:carboxymuconolactone decarboxylase family protein [Dactylosporangium roseum]UWZ39227.1 carboxymuconolactone decarboxylase family protein [Dactylosporangium roseum]
MTDMVDGGSRELGMTVRRQVLGDEYVDAAMGRLTEFSGPLQELILEYCWGTIWTRDHLDRRTRSLVNLGILTALNRPHELRIHTQGALNNGCTTQQIREVLLQAAIYCGIPAAVDAFRVAGEVVETAHRHNGSGDGGAVTTSESPEHER